MINWQLKHIKTKQKRGEYVCAEKCIDSYRKSNMNKGRNKVHISSSVFRTQSLTFFLNAARSSRHMIDASTLAAESQFGSLSIETTDSKIVSIKIQNIKFDILKIM